LQEKPKKGQARLGLGLNLAINSPYESLAKAKTVSLFRLFPAQFFPSRPERRAIALYSGLKGVAL
jgi:hypothetical protein